MPRKPANPTALPPHHCNRVWLELERSPQGVGLPAAELQAFREKQIELANNLLRRLNPEDTTVGTEKGMHFWWSERCSCYCLTTSEAGTYTELDDSGYWFNLDWFGRSN